MSEDTMIIKNMDSIAVSELRKDALEIISSGLRAINTRNIVTAQVALRGEELIVGKQRFALREKRRVFVVGIGKCALQASSVLEEVLGERLTKGIVLDVIEGELKRIKVYKGDHPLPTERNRDATKEIITLLEGLKEDDLVVFIISGGGSALLCQPKDFSCKQEADIINCLFRGGANIQDMNIVRKHMSLARGGNLAQYAYPAQVISLIFSDVPGDNLEFISSGPTVLDTTTIKDAEDILEKYKVKDRCGIAVELLETPKEEKYFKNTVNILMVSNMAALREMKKTAEELGYKSDIRTAVLKGEAREVALDIVKELRTAAPKSVLLYGGETTVTLKGRGQGGRNQELSLGALSDIGEGELISSIASDGMDNGAIAGALCDILTKQTAEELGLDIKKYLDENNAGALFSKTGSVVLTGPTGSNVSDLVIAIKS